MLNHIIHISMVLVLSTNVFLLEQEEVRLFSKKAVRCFLQRLPQAIWGNTKYVEEEFWVYKTKIKPSCKLSTYVKVETNTVHYLDPSIPAVKQVGGSIML